MLTPEVTLMTVTDPYTEPQPLAPPATETEPPKKRPTRLIVAAVAAGVVVLAAAIIAVVFASAKPGGSDPKDPKSAIPACREQVKSKMKAPATTKFPGGETVVNDGTQFEIDGAYDSQNGFGALMRGSYKCLLFHDNAGNIQIANLSVSEQ
jgi:hypothetical protein